MTGVKKQLQRWREDWLRYWNKTSLVMRIVIGAGVSLTMASLSLNWWNKPLATEVKDLHKKLDKVVLDNSFNLKLTDLKMRRARLDEQLKAGKKQMAALAVSGLNFDPADCGMVTLKLRQHMDEHHLELKKEEQIIPVALQPRKRRKIPIAAVIDDWRTTKTYPSFFQTVRYHYQLGGEFGDIFAFLRSLPGITKVFHLSNIVITTPAAEVVAGEGMLLLEFDLTVPVPGRDTVVPAVASGGKKTPAQTTAIPAAPVSVSKANVKSARKKR